MRQLSFAFSSLFLIGVTLLFPRVASASTLIFNSENDFTGQQGYKGWQYGYYDQDRNFVQAQEEIPQDYFKKPLDIPLLLSGTFGELTSTVNENRIYQEALIPHKVGERFLLTHRMRYEQRWNEGQDFRTRYRYMLFLNVPFNDTALNKKTIYLALYNELFVNGQRNIGNERTVELFDRNRTYMGLGYGLLDGLRMQLGWMLQTTDAWAKGQAQVSLHHSF